jgi:hypothetical protein
MSIAEWLFLLLQSGWVSLLDYLAAHVLLCLVPASFFLFVGPAVNILAIAYTGAAIGLPMPLLQGERAVVGSNVMGGQAR